MTSATRQDDPATIRRRLLADLPVEERQVELAGIPTAILEGGAGPPLVLLHGHGEFGATWGPVIPDLARDHRVVVPDLPGHGASGIPDGRLDAGRVLRWLGKLLEATDADPATLVGHLVGGAIAARFTIDRPDPVTRLVLVDTFGLGPFRPAARFALAMLGFVVRPTEGTQERLFQRCFADLDGLRERMDGRMELLEAYALHRARSAELKSALRVLMPRFAMSAIDDADLSGIAAPVSLIWGRHDRQVRLAVAQQASDRFGWPLHVIEDAADDPAVEQPEVFLAALRESLETAATRREVGA